MNRKFYITLFDIRYIERKIWKYPVCSPYYANRIVITNSLSIFY